jgi:hypothetical protein
MTPSSSIYKPLDPVKKEIRLVKLLPVSSDDPVSVSCQLNTVSLTDKLSFRALSYVCGDPSVTETILLNGNKRHVTKNLASALKCLIPRAQECQKSGIIFQLWADALCIDQSNSDEKNQQILLMAELFSSADPVYSFLGTDDCIPTAINLLKTISKAVQDCKSNVDILSNLDWLRSRPKLYANDSTLTEDTLIPNSHWEALHDFTDLTYWSRMWIFQEIVLSKPKRLIFIGPANAFTTGHSLKDALSCVRLVAQCFDSRPPRPEFVPEDMWEYLQRLTQFENIIKKVQGSLLAKDHLSVAEGSQRAALCILSAFDRERHATDPRDYYYSLMGPARLSLNPDYGPTTSVEDACNDFVRAYLDATRSSEWCLLFLHDAVGLKGSNDRLPSWAPCYHLPMVGRLRGVDPDACADRGVFDKENANSEPIPTLRSKTLRVLGLRITTVQVVSYPPTLTHLLEGDLLTYLTDFCRRFGETYITEIPTVVAFFATVLKQIVTKTNLEEFQVNDTTELQLNLLQHIPTLVEFEMLKVGRLFHTPEGYLGVAPLDVGINDIVCVLDGIQYPVILRSNAHHFVVIGPCFVQGLMTGEAKYIAEARGLSQEVFNLE